MKTLPTFDGVLRAQDLNALRTAIMRSNLAAGKGVVEGLDLHPGEGLSVRVTAGEFSAQVGDVVPAEFTVPVPPNTDRFLWIEGNDVPSDVPTHTLEPEGSDPGSTYVCLGRVKSDSDSIVVVTTEGRQRFGWRTNP